MSGKTASGRFKRSHEVWTPERWDDGYVDPDGRFRVYRPDYPRCYAEGYALRAHVVWWLHHGEVHPAGSNLHHVNQNRLDDWIENLCLMEHGRHSSMHNAGTIIVNLTCDGCGRDFVRDQTRWEYRRSQGYDGDFCSLACYQRTPRKPEHKKAISEGLKRAYAGGIR